MSQDKKESSVTRAYKLIEVLAGNEFTPLSTTVVADQMQLSKGTACKLLQQAEIAGWVEKTIDGRWRCTAVQNRLCISIYHGIQAAKTHLEDVIHNRTAGRVS